jgi:hypothetical protein
MKKNLLLILSIGLLLSCSDDDNNGTGTQDTTRELLFLKVNFTSNAFEGGKLYQFENIEMGNTIPFEEIVESPDDHGRYTLKYIPTGDVVFDGEVVWMGGHVEQEVPSQFDAPESYILLNSAATTNLDEAQYFMPTVYDGMVEGTPVDVTAAWNAVSNLEIVHDYISEGAKVGVVLYTPALGLFDPEPARWFIVLYK